MVKRFGKIVDGNAEPGIHYSLPAPIDEVVLVNSEDIQKIDTVPVSEPLIPDLNAENYRKGRKKFIISKGNIKPQSIPELSGNGVILAGPDSNSNYQEALITLSEKLQAPLLADPLSNLRKYIGVTHPGCLSRSYCEGLHSASERSP